MYPYFKEWQKHVNEDTVVYFDADQIAYLCSAANEDKVIIATHKTSGNKKEFKNRTEFWGNKKKEIGGWLQDLNTTRQVEGKSIFSKEDFDVEDVQRPREVKFCYSNIKLKIQFMLNHLGLTKYKCVLGGENNFRLELEAPEQYKSNRADTLRPVQLKEAREYLIQYHDALVIDNVEADDFLAIKGYESVEEFKKTGIFPYLVVSFDKDQLGGQTFILNSYTEEGILKHPIPILINNSDSTGGLGSLFLEKNKVKGYGFKFMMFQLLMGDSTDCIKPYQSFGVRFGETSAYQLIQPCTSHKEVLQSVVKQYKEWFPNGVSFTNWDGKEVNQTAGQWMNTIFKMIYMLTSEKDKTNIMSLIKKYGVEV